MTDQDPMSVFRYALKSSESQRQYPGRFKVVLDYLGLKGTIEDQAAEFAKRVQPDHFGIDLRMFRRLRK
jgi:hypothetical protein